jgi:signal transduction histidine kinase
MDDRMVRPIAGRPGVVGLVADAALALVLAAIGLVSAPHLGGIQPAARPVDALSNVLVVLAALPLAVRRVWPVATLAVTAAATTAYLLIGYPYGPVMVYLAIAVYSAAAHLSARHATIAGAVVLVALLAHIPARWARGEGITALGGVAPAAAWVVVPFALGWLVRVGRDSVARIRAEEIRRYAFEERLRIAQEVHDVVGHGLAAINMQAEIALHLLPTRPEQAGPALAAISRTSKEALDELRSTLAVVRRGDGEPRMPAPGVAQIDELVARMSRTGVAVAVKVDGGPRTLPAAVDLAAYRIVQEALTNVLRHSGTAAAAVVIGYQPERLIIEVTDDGRGGLAAAGTGHGLNGMRERAAALGGSLAAGPRAGGGFRVHAELPLPPAES